jgi:hypothetical protein
MPESLGKALVHAGETTGEQNIPAARWRRDIATGA